MGRDRHESQGALLRHHRRGATCARDRKGGMESHRVDHPRPAAGGVMPLREWLNRLWGTLRRRRTDRDLEEELRMHLEMAAEDAQRRRATGISPEQAFRTARLEAGGVAQAMEALRDQRGLPWLEDFARDISYGCRMLARNPAFAIVAVLSLAMGIGANTAIFSFADGLLLRPLTVPRPSDVVTVGSSATTTMRSVLLSSFRDYVD